MKIYDFPDSCVFYWVLYWVLFFRLPVASFASAFYLGGTGTANTALYEGLVRCFSRCNEMNLSHPAFTSGEARSVSLSRTIQTESQEFPRSVSCLYLTSTPSDMSCPNITPIPCPVPYAFQLTCRNHTLSLSHRCTTPTRWFLIRAHTAASVAQALFRFDRNLHAVAFA